MFSCIIDSLRLVGRPGRVRLEHFGFQFEDVLDVRVVAQRDGPHVVDSVADRALDRPRRSHNLFWIEDYSN